MSTFIFENVISIEYASCDSTTAYLWYSERKYPKRIFHGDEKRASGNVLIHTLVKFPVFKRKLRSWWCLHSSNARWNNMPLKGDNSAFAEIQYRKLEFKMTYQWDFNSKLRVFAANAIYEKIFEVCYFRCVSACNRRYNKCYAIEIIL